MDGRRPQGARDVHRRRRCRCRSTAFPQRGPAAL